VEVQGFDNMSYLRPPYIRSLYFQDEHFHHKIYLTFNFHTSWWHLEASPCTAGFNLFAPNYKASEHHWLNDGTVTDGTFNDYDAVAMKACLVEMS